MYNNNGQNQGNFGQNNGSMNPANPNGGYLKPGQRQDQWYGNLTVTPELLAEIQRTGKVRINVNEVKTNQYGPARRMTAKPYTEVQRPQGGNDGFNQGQPQQSYGQPMQGNQNYNQGQGNFNQGQPQQSYGQPTPNDEIPFF